MLSVGNGDLSRQDWVSSLSLYFESQEQCLRDGSLRLILQLPNEMSWREAGNQLKINAKYTQDK